MILGEKLSCLYELLTIKIKVLLPTSFYFLANICVSRTLFRVIHMLIAIISVAPIALNKVFLLKFPGWFFIIRWFEYNLTYLLFSDVN